MSVSNELHKPETSDKFEELCLELYARVWKDPGCMRVGVSGQAQFGLDIVGTFDGRSIGIQCKHYNKKPFTLSIIKADVEKADAEGISVNHLLFATTASNNATLVLKIRELSEERGKSGKFTISVDFWDAICGKLRTHADIGRAHIPNFPGADTNRTRVLLEEHTEIYAEDQEQNRAFQTESLQAHAKTASEVATIRALLENNSTPKSRGDEVNKLLASQLDLVRDRIREGRIREAREILASLGEQITLGDNFSRFRWHTCRGACLLAEDCEEEAAAEYLIAYGFAPDEEKALANRARAFLLKREFNLGLQGCEDGIAKHPSSALLWALKMNARMLLDQEHPDEGLPESLVDEGDILYTLSHIRQKQNRDQEAYELARRCYEKDTKSLEARRLLLTSALTWATVDPVAAHFGQISSKQQKAIQKAVAAFEPLEDVLESIQSGKASLEVTNNVAVALQLIGETERGRRIALRGLQRHPLAEGLLRIRINELDDKDDISAIRQFTDNRLSDLPTELLIILAEVSANHGKLDWYRQLESILKTRELDEKKSADLDALSVHATWMAGNHAEALTTAQARLDTGQTNILLATFLSRMLRKQGQDAESEKQARRCFVAAKKSSSSVALVQTADLLYDFGLHFEAAELYGKLIGSPGRDHLTQRYLICLVESDQRERARRAIEALPTEVRELSPFRRIEANLARASGNWARLRDLMKLELDKKPFDSSAAVGYVGALHRLQDVETLKSFLASDPIFDKPRPENEFEFAKYQANHGFCLQGIKRLYRLFRSHPQDARIAGFYLTILLLSEELKELPLAEIVVPGMAVQLRYQHDFRWIAIEESGLPQIVTWAETVHSDSAQAHSILGKKVGDKVPLDTGFGKVEAELVRYENILLFAARKAQEVIAAAAGSSGPLWSVNLRKHDGELDIEPILESLRRRSSYVEGIFAQYSKQRFLISNLANALGTDSVTLLLEWPYKHASLFVSIGTHEEREQGRALLRQEGLRYVLDLVTLAELTRWELFEKALKVLGKPLVPQTLKEQLLRLTQLVNTPRATASMREEGGQFYMTDIPTEYYEHRKQFLQQLLDCVNNYCEVVPTFGPALLTENQRLLAQLLDNASLDAAYLALERKAVLLSEDGAFRLIAAQTGITDTLGLQPLLMHLRDAGLIKHFEYSRIILEKLSLGHDFISVGSEDLFWAAKVSKGKLSPLVEVALDTFKRPSLELQSGVRVCAEFLRAVGEHLQPRVVKMYYEKCLDALCHGREPLAGRISEFLRIQMERFLRSLKPSRRSALRRELGELLAISNVVFRMTKIALAIRKAFSGVDEE